MDISALRQDYQNSPFTPDQLDPDPMRQFERWFCQASEAGILEPNAMCVATVSTQGQPSLRTVLLKFFDQRGFVFFTNYGSRKAQEIAANPRVSLIFPWIALARQVIVTGQASKISTLESARYFASRPRESQLGAWVSQQSSVIPSRELLRQELLKLREKFQHGEVPLPDFWGGYRVAPDSVEFWQGQTSRLHDRLIYQQDEQGQWQIRRLAP